MYPIKILMWFFIINFIIKQMHNDIYFKGFSLCIFNFVKIIVYLKILLKK